MLNETEIGKKSIKHRNLSKDFNKGLQLYGGLHLTKVKEREIS